MFRKLALILVLALGGGFAAVDQVARVYAEHQIEARADQYYPHENGSSASISGWPFTVRLLASAEVKRIDVSLYGVEEQQLFLRRLTLTLTGVKLDRDQLFRRKVRLRDIDSGRVAVDIDGSSIAKRVNRDLRFHDGAVEVHQSVAGREVVVTGTVVVQANVLQFQPREARVEGGGAVPVGGAAFNLRLPQSDLWPCTADVRVIEGGLLVGCRVENIPSRLIGAELR